MVIAAALTTAVADAGGPGYVAAVEQWRAEREARLKADDGWLTLAGLFWLSEGENRIGTTAQHAISLPKTAGPAEIGSIVLDRGKAALELRAGVAARVNGRQVRAADLQSDAEGDPDVVALGSDVTFYVIRRGNRYGVRVKDRNSRYRRNFAGLGWFPIREEWRIEAKFVAWERPRKLVYDLIVGEKIEEVNPGYVIFTTSGREFRMLPVIEGDHLSFMFRDRTAGKKTYAAGRFLVAEMPKDARVVLDFNKAYNPPCAFTPYSTCPLPPRENRLPIEIPAGEMLPPAGKK